VASLGHADAAEYFAAIGVVAEEEARVALTEALLANGLSGRAAGMTLTLTCVGCVSCRSFDTRVLAT
jgi:hypothetical protein